jgi:hypothetical protein
MIFNSFGRISNGRIALLHVGSGDTAHGGRYSSYAAFSRRTGIFFKTTI